MVFFTYKKLGILKRLRRILVAYAFLFVGVSGVMAQEPKPPIPFKEGIFVFDTNPAGETFKFKDQAGLIWNVATRAIKNSEELSAQVPQGAFQYAKAHNISIPAKLVCVSECNQVASTSPGRLYKEIQGTFELSFDKNVMQRIGIYLAQENPTPVNKNVVDNPTLGPGLTQFTQATFLFDRIDTQEGFVYLTKDNKSYKVSIPQLNGKNPRPSIKVMNMATALKGTMPLYVRMSCASAICSYSSLKDAQGNDIRYNLVNGRYSWDFDWKQLMKIAQTQFPDRGLKGGNILTVSLVNTDAQILYFTNPSGQKYVLRKADLKGIPDFLLRASGTPSQPLSYGIKCASSTGPEIAPECKLNVFVPKDGSDPYYTMSGMFELGSQPPLPKDVYNPTVNGPDLSKLRYRGLNDMYYIFTNVEAIAPSPQYPSQKVRMEVTYFVPRASVAMSVLSTEMLSSKAKLVKLQCMRGCKQSSDSSEDGKPIRYLTGEYEIQIAK